MLTVPPRLAVVRDVVEKLWASNSDGRWSALERALIDILEPKKKPRPDKTDAVDAPRAPLAKAPARDNVILLWTPRVSRACGGRHERPAPREGGSTS